MHWGRIFAVMILGLALAGAAPAQTADAPAAPAAADVPPIPAATAPAAGAGAPAAAPKAPEAAPLEAEAAPTPPAPEPDKPARAPRRAPRRAARPTPPRPAETRPAETAPPAPKPVVAPKPKPVTPPPAADARPFFTEYQDPEQRRETPLGRVLVDLVVKLGIVLAIAYGSLYILRGVMARQGMAPGRQRHLRVLESASLGPNRSVHVVRVGEKVMVVGSTPEQVTMLAEVDDVETLRQLNAEREAGSFQSRLSGALSNDSTAAGPDEASLAGQVRGSAKRLWDQVQDLRDFRGRGGRS